MKNWRVELTAGVKSLAETKIQRGISKEMHVTPTIHNCHDATKPYSQKMYSRIQT